MYALVKGMCLQLVSSTMSKVLFFVFTYFSYILNYRKTYIITVLIVIIYYHLIEHIAGQITTSSTLIVVIISPMIEQLFILIELLIASNLVAMPFYARFIGKDWLSVFTVSQRFNW